ncbi:MAG: DUF3800 domain-containing protein [Syntrophobacteraceae bacterium]
MQLGIQEVYCDESGSTGNKLLDPSQPYFTYATVAISREEARILVEKIRKDYQIQAPELKATKLIRFNRGRHAITEILETLRDRMNVSIFNKKFSLASQFFEYVFEPTIADNNHLFYSIDFHKFIGNLLYVHFQAQAKYAEQIFDDFQIMMKRLDIEKSNHMFSSLAFPQITPVLNSIKEFCIYNRETIVDNLNFLKGFEGGKWILDLTHTALFSGLARMGQKYEQLLVFCDSSKPLESNLQMFNVMINRSERLYNAFYSHEQPITFNMASGIQLVDSISHPGIQIADVVAGAAAYFIQNSDDQHAKKWREYAPSVIHPFVAPEADYIDLTSMSAQRNLILLEELVLRSKNGEPLLPGLPDFVAHATRYLIAKPPSTSNPMAI